MTARNLFILMAAFTLQSQAALAAPVEYKVDPGHSSVEFEVRHMLSKVRGSFNEFEGDFKYDDKKIEASEVKFKITATSINTNNKKRDEHLNSPDFFDTAKFKDISFKSTKITSDGGEKFKITGDLTMHGVTKPVTLQAEHLGNSKDPWGHEVVSFQASGTVNRKDFGINWNKSLDSGGVLLGDDVKIDIAVEAQKADAAPKKK